MFPVVGYVLFDTQEKKFVGCDHQSGNYPWKSSFIQGITIYTSEKEAEEYKNISGFKRKRKLGCIPITG